MPLVPSVLVLFVIGAVLGYGFLVAGAFVGILALFLLVLLITRSEQVGSYLAGFGLAGSVVLGHLLLTCPSPSCQYDASTPIAMAVFALTAAGGIGLLARAVLRRARSFRR